MQFLIALSLVAAAGTVAADERILTAPPDIALPTHGAGDLAGVHFAAAAVIAAAAADDNEDACTTAIGYASYCYDALPTNAPSIDQANCFCCSEDYPDNEYIAPIYTSCESYIASASPTATNVITVLSVIESFCGSVSSDGFTCSTYSGSSTASITSSAALAGTTQAAGCTSFNSVYLSCASATRSFSDLNDDDAASCLCYNSRGRYTTALDDYLSQCAAFVSTASPDSYESYAALTTFCEDYSPATSVVATFSDKIATFGGEAEITSTASATAGATAGAGANAATTTPSTTSPRTVTVAPTTTSETGNAAGRARPTGVAAWLAVVLPLVL